LENTEFWILAFGYSSRPVVIIEQRCTRIANLKFKVKIIACKRRNLSLFEYHSIMLTFAHPWLFLALALPLLIHWVVKPYHEVRLALRSPWFGRLARFSGRQPAEGAVVPRRTIIEAATSILVWSLIVIALAQPQYLEPPIHRTVPTRDLLLLVDLSGSMATEDFTNEAGQQVDRLTAVKEVLADFLSRREGDRVGLIVFGNAAFVQVPFTQDLDAGRMLLDELAPRMAGPKTALGDAIGLGITLFERSEVKQRVMIALTDGNDTGSQVPPAEAARIAADKDIVVYTVAVGDPTAIGEEKLDEEALRDLAKTTGGQYFYAGDREQLEEIYTALDRLEARQVETISHRPRRDLYYWPVGAAMIFSLFYYLVVALKGIKVKT
jgi:Ca-activated chloride channel family protein